MLDEDWDEFRDMLAAGLVARRDDGTYELTILGLLEVENERAINARPSNSATEGGNGTRATPTFFLIEPATSSPRQ